MQTRSILCSITVEVQKLSSKCPTNCRISEMDRADIDLLVKYGVFTHPSDAIKGTMRDGIRLNMEERGIKHVKVVIPEEEYIEEEEEETE